MKGKNDVSVCACVHMKWACHPEHMSARNKFQPIPPHIFKNICAVHQCHSSNSSGTTHVNPATLVYFLGTPAFPLFNLRHIRDFKSPTSRRGTLYIPFFAYMPHRITPGTVVGFPRGRFIHFCFVFMKI